MLCGDSSLTCYLSVQSSLCSGSILSHYILDMLYFVMLSTEINIFLLRFNSLLIALLWASGPEDGWVAAGRVLLSTAVLSRTGLRKHRQQATLSFSVARKIRFQSSEMAAGQCAVSVPVCLCGGGSSSTVVCSVCRGHEPGNFLSSWWFWFEPSVSQHRWYRPW